MKSLGGAPATIRRAGMRVWGQVALIFSGLLVFLPPSSPAPTFPSLVSPSFTLHPARPPSPFPPSLPLSLAMFLCREHMGSLNTMHPKLSWSLADNVPFTLSFRANSSSSTPTPHPPLAHLYSGSIDLAKPINGDLLDYWTAAVCPLDTEVRSIPPAPLGPACSTYSSAAILPLFTRTGRTKPHND